MKQYPKEEQPPALHGKLCSGNYKGVGRNDVLKIAEAEYRGGVKKWWIQLERKPSMAYAE